MKNTYILPKRRQLQLVKSTGFGLVSKAITRNGQPITIMYRTKQHFGWEDSGWRFESSEHDMSMAEDCTLNAIANLDPAVIHYLDAAEDTSWRRIPGTDSFEEFERIWV